MRSFILTTLLMLFSLTPALQAQFEGQIRMNLYGTDGQGNKNVNTIDLFATDERILIRGTESVNLHQTLTAQGLLIRNDSRDFIVMMDGNKAIQFSKTDLEGAFRMFARMDSQNNTGNTATDDASVSYHYTNEVRTINGFEATELRMEKSDEEGYLSIWLTPEIKVNWGMLAEPWVDVPKDMRSTADRLSQELKSSNFPVLIEVYDPKKDKKQVIMELDSVNRNRVSGDIVEVPSGMSLMGLNEFMFMLMMGN